MSGFGTDYRVGREPQATGPERTVSSPPSALPSSPPSALPSSPPSALPSSPPSALPSPESDPYISVMLCDDHVVVLAGLERLIGTFPGIRVVGTANNGREGIALARATKPQVVLMDLQMPDLDGIEATKQITASLPFSSVVILTSFSDRHRIKGALSAGAIGYQLKDASPAELEAAIRAAARGEAPIAPKVALELVRTPTEPAQVISEREIETLALVAKGFANKQIARTMGITEATVKAHLTSIFRRIGAENRTQAARWYEQTYGEPR